MSLSLSAIPLAGVAGMLSILSPCVWPLVPAVMAASASSGRGGAWFLGLGLVASFAAAGTLLTWLLLTLSLDPELFRWIAALLLLLIGVTLVSRTLGERTAAFLSRLSGRFGGIGAARSVGSVGQLGVGALLGLVWLPCVGPTLGAAIALASLGQDMGMAFLVMLAFGAGTAFVLLLAGFASGRALARWRPGILEGAERGKRILGGILLLMAALVLTGLDKRLEAMALELLPRWAISL
jgi:cytochrome c-type biogenesis protein